MEVLTKQVLDHMVACMARGRAPGKLYFPRSVAIDPATNCIYVAEGGIFPSFARVSIFSERSHGIIIGGGHARRDNMYVTDWAAHVVFQFKIEADLRLVARIGSLVSYQTF